MKSEVWVLAFVRSSAVTKVSLASCNKASEAFLEASLRPTTASNLILLASPSISPIAAPPSPPREPATAAPTGPATTNPRAAPMEAPEIAPLACPLPAASEAVSALLPLKPATVSRF